MKAIFVSILIGYINWGFTSSSQQLNLRQFADCISFIYLEKDDNIRCDLHELYLNSDYVYNTYKRVFGTGLELPKKMQCVNGIVHFASELEMFNDNVFCFYELKDISTQKMLSFTLTRHLGKKITEFKLKFKRHDGGWIHETTEITNMEEHETIQPRVLNE